MSEQRRSLTTASILSTLTDTQHQEFAKLLKETWQSIVVLVLLPGGFPLCYGASESLLYLDHEVWQGLHEKLKAYLARYYYASIGHKVWDVSFTWGFRGVGQEFLNDINDEKTKIYIWNYICTNIIIDPVAKGKFVEAINEAELPPHERVAIDALIRDLEFHPPSKIWPTQEQLDIIIDLVYSCEAPLPKDLITYASVQSNDGTYKISNLIKCYKKEY